MIIALMESIIIWKVFFLNLEIIIRIKLILSFLIIIKIVAKIIVMIMKCQIEGAYLLRIEIMKIK